MSDKWIFDAIREAFRQITSDIDFTDEAVVQCDIPVVK